MHRFQIQVTALPIMLSDSMQDFIGHGVSGSGKTTSYVLGILCRIKINEKFPQAIRMVPTVELAEQIMRLFMKIGRYSNIECHLLIDDDTCTTGILRLCAWR